MLTSSTAEPEMTAEEFVMIRDFIHEKSGIFFAENKTYLLKNRLIKRMSDLEIKSYRDYFYHVKYDTSLVEFKELMNLITTNETSFFRNEPQLLSFSDEVLPLMVKTKKEGGGPKSIKIWSAGCSTGEEPYTLAMMIMEKLGNLSGWKVEVIANDISEQVLSQARKGEYSGITLRNVKPTVLNRFFDKVGDSFRVKPEVKALVKFSHINLNEPRQMSMHSGFDTIFCRNVMIYFSDEVKRQIVRGYYNSLQPGGYFYIGHSETLHGISKAFKLVYFKNALVYQKEAVAAASGSKPGSMSASATAGPLAGKPNAAGGARRAMDLLSKIKPMTVNR
ncbi:MAG: protein-glutamate O-methyltransferase CheR [candidate division Zixibacteria bacterium]|nr:protein-glutamate O-methyltransferase CheR [candidate division Zixibacteria bacterium]MDH3939292.1 protein-glutamate O-methyltransferase CheR [candidate division Zixibacteria bacterium]MDH4032722.1 protein-glutamate O-methyltransferase CheR [candidate division Zixibacteria bacterium]